MLVKEIMSKQVICARPDETIVSVAKKMKDEKIGAVPVCNAGKLLGMVTDRDIVTRAVAKSSDLSQFTAGKVMTNKPISSRETETIEDVVHLMEQNHIRRLPVMDTGDHLVGMVSLDDIAVHSPHELSGEALEALSFAKKSQPAPTLRS